VDVVVVVTDDPRARRTLDAPRVLVVGDVPDRGLNPALEHGAAQARARDPACGVGALSADLPALRPAALGAALDAASAHASAFVCDTAGTGTTLLTARPGVSLRPRYGPRSRARHAAAGSVEIAGEPGALASLRRDVDTEVDLLDALRLGTGPETARVARLLGLSSPASR